MSLYALEQIPQSKISAVKDAFGMSLLNDHHLTKKLNANVCPKSFLIHLYVQEPL